MEFVTGDGDITDRRLPTGEIANIERRYEEAREWLNKSIALSEKDRASRVYLQKALAAIGNGHFQEEHFETALDFYRKGLDEGYSPEVPGYWSTRYNQAMSFLALGRNQKAEPILREISEEGDPLLQQKVQIKLGDLGLEKELKRLPLYKDIKGVI